MSVLLSVLADVAVAVLLMIVVSALLALGAWLWDQYEQRRFKRLTPAEREAEIKRAWRRNGL